MFDNLSERLNVIFKKLKGLGRLSESDVSDGLRHIKIALLEADVDYLIVKKIISDISKRALGQEVMASLTPAQQVIKIVNDEIQKLMGSKNCDINLNNSSITTILLVGLQGSGKTTTAAKLALHLKRKKRTPLLVSVDTSRPAAFDQTKILAKEIDVPVFEFDTGEVDPVKIAHKAFLEVDSIGCDTIIIDTAGRLYADEYLMNQLLDIKKIVNPSEILLVADAMTGQDSVNIAKTFNEKIGITGIILSKMDSDARGGAALSMKFSTKKPIKFIGVGEKLDDLEVFHPDRIASRILGMGDLLSIIDKAQMILDKEKTIEFEKKIRKNNFSLDDFRIQMNQMKKMGSLKDILGMMPGFGAMKGIKNIKVDENEFVRIDAIISSMTLYERNNYSIINGSRRKRIAHGSGTKIQDVNRLLKNYAQMMKLMKKFNKHGGRGFKRGMLPF